VIFESEIGEEQKSEFPRAHPGRPFQSRSMTGVCGVVSIYDVEHILAEHQTWEGGWIDNQCLLN
jgi:hypothetical protein